MLSKTLLKAYFISPRFSPSSLLDKVLIGFATKVENKVTLEAE
jgi:hypothetical protein